MTIFVDSNGQDMKIALFTRRLSPAMDSRLEGQLSRITSAGHELYRVAVREDIRPGTELMLAVGGDGTFLSASYVVGDSGIPVLGVNMGRLGFLSENTPEAAAEAILSGNYALEKRSVLEVQTSDGSESGLAMNEVVVQRTSPAMLGVDVCIDGAPLPTYWADGLLVATSAGSTAYSLSVGGPIVTPESRVLIISPIAPHNLNVRPLIVPDSSRISLRFRSRSGRVMLTTDNRTRTMSSDVSLQVGLAQFSLNRVRLSSSDFIKALTSKLFWGEDRRNSNEQ